MKYQEIIEIIYICLPHSFLRHLLPNILQIICFLKVKSSPVENKRSHPRIHDFSLGDSFYACVVQLEFTWSIQNMERISISLLNLWGVGGTSGHLTDNDFWISCIQIDQATKFDLNVTILSQKERQGHPQDLAICLWYPYHKNNKIKKIHLQNSPKFQKKLKCLIINEN